MASGTGNYRGEIGLTLPGELIITKGSYVNPWLSSTPAATTDCVYVPRDSVGILMGTAVIQQYSTWNMMYHVLLPSVGRSGWARGEFVRALVPTPGWDPFARERDLSKWPPIYNAFGARISPTKPRFP